MSDPIVVVAQSVGPTVVVQQPSPPKVIVSSQGPKGDPGNPITAWTAALAYPEGSLVINGTILWEAPTGGAPARSTFTPGDWTEVSSITPAFGTTAGTVAQGNDSRIVGAASAAALASEVSTRGTADTALAAGISSEAATARAAEAARVLSTAVGAASGVASLDSGSQVPVGQLGHVVAAIPNGTYAPTLIATAGAPTTGTYPAGASVVDKNGIIWNTQAGGSPPVDWLQSSGNPAKVIAAGNLGASPAIALASKPSVLVTGTLTANCAMTVSGLTAGCSTVLLLQQDATGGRTLSIGGTSLSIPTTPSTPFFVQLWSPNGTDLYIELAPQVGPAGPAGTNGANGANGAAGPTGTRGSLLYTGTGPPGTISGQLNNDLYIDTTTTPGEMWELVTGTWTDVGNIRGPTGVGYIAPLSIKSPTLSSALSTGAAITSVPINPSPISAASANHFLLNDGYGHSQTVVLTAPIAVGATSIAVGSFTPNFAFPINCELVPTILTQTAPASGYGHARITLVGGGGGASGGGAAALSGSPVANQIGSAGGGAGAVVTQVVPITGGMTLTCALGVLGTGGLGGIASVGATGNAGGLGGSGLATTVTGTGISLSAPGGSPGGATLANSTATCLGGVYGHPGGTSVTTTGPPPGFGGQCVSNTPGVLGGGPLGYSGRGGTGGGAANTTNGGGAGTATVGGAIGGSGTSSGVSSTAAPANSGQGGDGAGGGAPGGAGGNGAPGGSGFILIEWLV